jgi:hypothetical protein
MGNISNPEQWAARERLRFIERVVYWRGSVRREEVAGAFNLSAHQISADLQKYQEMCPGALIYSLKRKCYEGAADMKCRLHEPKLEEALAMFLEEDGCWKVSPMGKGLADQPGSVGRVELPVRRAVPEVERRVFLGVSLKRKVCVIYRSVHGAGKEAWRWISPHAFGHDGYRWHVRAWCGNDGKFKDFVLSRIQQAEFPIEPAGPLPMDDEWVTWETLRLIPNPGFTPEQQAGLRLDYDIPPEGLELKVRRALLEYTLEHLRLPGAPWEGKPFLVPLENRRA